MENIEDFRILAKELLPDGHTVGSSVSLAPIEKGFVFGVYWDRKRTLIGQTSVRPFVKFCLFPDEPGLLNSKTVWNGISDVWDSESLYSNRLYIKEKLREYRSELHSLKAFSTLLNANFEKQKNLRTLFEIVQCHYLDSTCDLLPNLLNRESLEESFGPLRHYEYDLVQKICNLQNEWESIKFEELKDTRIDRWLALNKLPKHFFDKSFA